MVAAVVILVLVVAVLAYAASRPSAFSIRRETTIAADAGTIYPLIADFHRWAAWSPYEAIDPTMTKTFGGAPAGKGAVYEWSGNAKAGAGRMEILEADAPSSVGIDLHMLKPMEGRNQVAFTLDPDGSATRVSWTMSGRYAFPAKVAGLFLNMDRMIGRDFEKGLAAMKTEAEK